jgi:hypothetical protein
VKFVTAGDALTIHMEGMEKLWALKSKLDVPRAAISQVDFTSDQPVMQDFRGFLRMPGSALPWHFVAGSFWQRHDREFWYVHFRQPGLLTIELKKDALPYERLRFSCDPQTAQAIADWWRDVSPPDVP